MKNLIFSLIAGFLVVLFFSCEESLITNNSAVDLKQPGPYEGPGTFTGHSNGNDYPFPEIIYQEIIPASDDFKSKTLAWRITWPIYADDADPEKIPTIWSGDGVLHSIDYLNHVDPQNTYNTLFSLYFDETIQRSRDMDSELDYVAGAPKKSMPVVGFTHPYCTAAGLQSLVEGDAAFNMMWQVPYPLDDDKLEYEDDDILFYKIDYKIDTPEEYRRYGGIRIVSMEPRIIEVFLQVPHNGNLSATSLVNGTSR